MGKKVVLLLFSIFTLTFVMANFGYDNADLPSLKQSVGFAQTSNVTYFWNTTDLGILGSILEVNHSALTPASLLWSNSGHSIDEDLNMDNYDLDNVGNVWATHINATTGNFTDLYVSNNTLHIGENIKLGVDDGILNITGGNVSAPAFFGDGAGLFNIDLDSINFANGTVTAITFNATNFTGGDFIGDGSQLTGIETELRTETVITTNNITTGHLDFEIKQIIVTPTNLTKPYNFEMTETTSGDYIDKNRIEHIGIWNIEKNFAINDTSNIVIVGDDTFNITIKYLDNFL